MSFQFTKKSRQFKKIFEKLIFDVMYKHLKDNDFLTPFLVDQDFEGDSTINPLSGILF